MRYPSSRDVLMLVGGIALACTTQRSREPVETTTGDGRTTSSPALAADGRSASLVRVVNALPRSDIDIAAGDSVLFRGVDYRTVTEYRELADRVTQFTVRYAGQDNVLAGNRELMTKGARYTIIALAPNEGEVKLRVLQDHLARAPAKAMIRVINTVTGANDVQVLVAGQPEPLFRDVDPGREAGYQEIEPATATLIFKIRDGAPLARLERTPLEAGRAYTIVLAGTGPDQVTTIRFEDRPVGSGAEVSFKVRGER